MTADGLVYRIDPAATLYWPTAFQRPARHGSNDGAAQQHHQAMAWPRAGDHPDEPHDGQGNSQPDDKYDVFVYDYQGQLGNNFRVYFHPQATQNLYGGVAPCSNTTMRPEVDGITCPLAGTAPTAPSAPTGVRIIR